MTVAQFLDRWADLFSHGLSAARADELRSWLGDASAFDLHELVLAAFVAGMAHAGAAPQDIAAVERGGVHSREFQRRCAAAIDGHPLPPPCTRCGHTPAEPCS